MMNPPSTGTITGRAAGIALVLASTCGFALAPVLTERAGAAGVSPGMVTALRFLLAMLLLIPFAARIRPALPRSPRAIGAFLVMGLCYAVETYGYALAVTRIPVGLAVLLLFLFPLLVALIVAVADRRPPPLLRWCALILAFCGVALALASDFSQIDRLGVIGAVAAAVAAAISVWLGDRLARRHGALPVTLLSLSCAGLLFLPPFLAFGAPLWPDSAPALLLATAPGLLFGIALTLFFAASRRLGAVQASLFANVEPALATLFALQVSGQTPSATQSSGTALVILALCLPERWPRRTQALAADRTG